jgi:hypothetical protein
MFRHTLTAGLMVLAVATFACGGTGTPQQSQISDRPVTPTASALAQVQTSSPIPTRTLAPARTSTTAPTLAPTTVPTSTPAPVPTRTSIPTAAPTLAPTVKPAPTANTCGAATNPWGYTFCGGSTISSPASNFCSYFNCIASFWTGVGYVEQCMDATFGKSGGRSGSCSSHGGNSRPLYGP